MAIKCCVVCGCQIGTRDMVQQRILDWLDIKDTPGSKQNTKTLSLTEPKNNTSFQFTWSPVSDTSINSFHQKLVIIGSLSNLTTRKPNLRRNTWMTLEPDDIVCVTHLKVVNEASDDTIKLQPKAPSSQSCIVPGYDANTGDLRRPKSKWKRLNECTIINSKKADDTFIVHTHCWELFHALWSADKGEHHVELTPLIFWRGAMRLQREHPNAFHYGNEATLPYDRSGLGYNDYHWYLYSHVPDKYHEERSIIFDSRKQCYEYRHTFRLHFHSSLKWKQMQATELIQFWRHFKAWMYFPLNRFPVESAFHKASRMIDFREPSYSISGSSKQKKLHLKVDAIKRVFRRVLKRGDGVESNKPCAFYSLPFELIYKILGCLDRHSTAQLSMTSKRMQKLAYEKLNKDAFRYLRRHHPHLLPITRREKQHWGTQMQKTKALLKEQYPEWEHTNDEWFPWLAYLHITLFTTLEPIAMLNRRRVFQVAHNLRSKFQRDDSEH